MASYDPSLYEPAYTLLQMIKNIEKYLKDNPQAAGIQNVEIDENSHLIVTLTDGTIIDAGEIDAGAGVVVDAALSDTSTNPVQNRVVKAAIDAKMTNPMNAAADLIVGGADGAPQRLGKGTAGQVLKMNDAGTAPTWGPPESGGMTNPMKALGDMIIGGVDGDPVRIAKGTAQQVLRMNSAGTLPEWVTPPSYVVNPMTAEGDLIVGGASSGNPIRLGKGTAGQVLKMNDAGTAPTWGPPESGGGGKQLYEHRIEWGAQGLFDACCSIINDSATPFTNTTLARYLYDKSTQTGRYMHTASGILPDKTVGTNKWHRIIYGISSTNGSSMTWAAIYISYSTSDNSFQGFGDEHYSDTVTQIIYDTVIAL